MDDDRKVKESKIESWCEDEGLEYFETSAKDDVEIEAAFKKLTKLASKNIKEESM